VPVLLIPELVNFLGPNDDWVTSGSDDGNFFMWDKRTGKLHGIYEGDSSVVNMVQGHPELPLIAVSGIDTTVKVSFDSDCQKYSHRATQLFAPTHGPSSFSKIKDAERIMEENRRPARRTQMVRLEDLAALLSPSGQVGGETIRMDPSVGSVAIGIPDCVGQ
jgi:WD40 repeat protein